MTERQITPLVMSFIKRAKMRSAAVEIKLTKTSSVAFSDLKDHQVDSLLHAKHGQVVFKIPDVGAQNPFDAFILSAADAWVVVVYYAPRKPKYAVFIDIDTWCRESRESDRKSLTFDRAKEIGELYTL